MLIGYSQQKSLNHSPIHQQPCPPSSEKRLNAATYGREATRGQTAPDGFVWLCVLCDLCGFCIHYDSNLIVTGRPNISFWRLKYLNNLNAISIQRLKNHLHRQPSANNPVPLHPKSA